MRHMNRPLNDICMCQNVTHGAVTETHGSNAALNNLFQWQESEQQAQPNIGSCNTTRFTLCECLLGGKHSQRTNLSCVL